jgi:hypothetical protein
VIGALERPQLCGGGFGIRVTEIGGCVATERKAGKFRLFVLFIGITEWTQITPSNGF